jgi:hypothetical protein
MPLRLNLGSGTNRRPAAEGWVNVDRFGAPDVVCDLEAERWPWADASVDEALFNHSLEHMGVTPDGFLHVIKELYRVCRDGAEVRVVAPNPRHDDYLDDPTHVRPITPRMLGLFSRARCEFFRSGGYSDTPLALIHGVDFELVSVTQLLDKRFTAAHEAGTLDLALFPQAVREYDMLLRVVKPPA